MAGLERRWLITGREEEDEEGGEVKEEMRRPINLTSAPSKYTIANHHRPNPLIQTSKPSDVVALALAPKPLV